MRVLTTDHTQTENRMVVPVGCLAGFLNWLADISPVYASDWVFFSTNIPFQQVARLCGADNYVAVKGIEFRFSDLVLASKGKFRARLHRNRIDCNQAIGLILAPLLTLAE